MDQKTVAIGDLEGTFRSLREPLGAVAFGIAALVLPPGTEQVAHYHEVQDEVYFVHQGRAGVEIDGVRHELGPGEAVYVPSTTPRQLWNAGESELIVLAVGASGGYVDGDARLVDDADAARVGAMLRGDVEGIRRVEP
ncbi:MAG TPA: cupin domain-containing protein [Solirubrobacterales bacterium]|nr:cupin domain-containing protein [Solirubrobacterales bacterium]